MKADVLASLMQADGYVSGEALSEKLGISRSAVWKAVKALRSQGYEIESATNRGYRLLYAPDFLNAENLRIYLKTRELAKHIYWKKVTGSTNDDAKAAGPLCPDKKPVCRGAANRGQRPAGAAMGVAHERKHLHVAFIEAGHRAGPAFAHHAVGRACGAGGGLRCLHGGCPN